MKVVCQADLARIFEFVLLFVRCHQTRLYPLLLLLLSTGVNCFADDVNKVGEHH